jgi:hypothetical protein
MKKFSKSLLLTCLWVALLLLAVSISGFFAVWALDHFAKLSFVSGIPIVATLYVCLGLLGIRWTVTPEELGGVKMKLGRFREAIRSVWPGARHRDAESFRKSTSKAQPIADATSGVTGNRAAAHSRNISKREEVAALKTVHSIVWGNWPSRSFVDCPLNPESRTNHASQK